MGLIEVRYLYARHETWGKRFDPEGPIYYGCLMAVSMADARKHLPPGTLVIKAKLDHDFAYFVSHCDQNIRKAAFDGARTKEDIGKLFTHLVTEYPEYDWEAAFMREP